MLGRDPNVSCSPYRGKEPALRIRTAYRGAIHSTSTDDRTNDSSIPLPPLHRKPNVYHATMLLLPQALAHGRMNLVADAAHSLDTLTLTMYHPVPNRNIAPLTKTKRYSFPSSEPSRANSFGT